MDSRMWWLIGGVVALVLVVAMMFPREPTETATIPAPSPPAATTPAPPADPAPQATPPAPSDSPASPATPKE